MEDVFVIVSDDMPYWMKGHVNANKDGSYTIFINGRLTIEEQRDAYQHELHHINNCDFEKLNCNEIERIAHYICG